MSEEAMSRKQMDPKIKFPLSEAGEFLTLGLKHVQFKPERLRNIEEKKQRKIYQKYYGTSPEGAHQIAYSLLTTTIDNAKVQPGEITMKHLHMGLHLLHIYSTEEVFAGTFQVNEKTVSTNGWKVVKKIAKLIGQHVLWPLEDLDDDGTQDEESEEEEEDEALMFDRTINGYDSDSDEDEDDDDEIEPVDDACLVAEEDLLDSIIMTVDGVHCPINEPKHPTMRKNKEYYSHKFKSAGFSYEIGISIKTNEVYWVNGPFKAGTSDRTIAERYGLGDRIPENRFILGDKGYRGLDFVCTRNSQDAPVVKEFKKRALARHETFNKRLKDFNCLRHRFRHGERKFKYAFEACVVLCIINMDLGSPLFNTFNDKTKTSADAVWADAVVSADATP